VCEVVQEAIKGKGLLKMTVYNSFRKWKKSLLKIAKVHMFRKLLMENAS
jgi:hypothetical protein